MTTASAITQDIGYDDARRNVVGNDIVPSLYLRGRVWWFSYIHWTGKRKCRSTGVRDKKTAKQIAYRVETQHALAIQGLIDPDDIETAERGRISALAALDGCLSRMSADHERIVREFIEHERISVAAEFGSREIIGSVHTFLETVKKRGVQHRRVNDHLRAIINAGEWLKKRGYIRHNRVKDIELAAVPDDPRIHHRAVWPHELAALADLPHGLWYRFCAFTGLRGAEAIRVERRDVDLADTPTLHVRAEVAKNGVAWTVPISRRMADLLAGHCHMRPGPVFPDIPKRRDTRRSWLKRDLDRLNIPDGINARSFRKAHKSWLQAAGIDAETIAHLRRDKGRGTERLRRTSYTDAEIVDPVLRSAVETLETWYEDQLRATTSATS